MLFLAILLSIAIPFAGHAQRKRGKQAPLPPPVSRPILVCRLATGGGFGALARYAAEFYRPGKLVYYGRKRMSKLGRYGYVLPDVLIKNMLVEAKKAKLIALPEPPSGPPDAPVDTLFLWVEGKSRTFRFSPVNAPEALIKYAQSIRDNLNAILEEQEPSETPADSIR